MSRAATGFMVLVGIFLLSVPDAPLGGPAVSAQEDGGADSGGAAGDEFIDPMGPNAACYVCHLTFVREELAQTHLRAQVTCVTCHGLSAGHANDENIGTTEPDITYERHQVNAACRECHEAHDVRPEEVVARWLERERPLRPPVCTDCHGTHKIEAPEEDSAQTPEGTEGQPSTGEGRSG